jgi:hypothetical protein
LEFYTIQHFFVYPSPLSAHAGHALSYRLAIIKKVRTL